MNENEVTIADAWQRVFAGVVDAIFVTAFGSIIGLLLLPISKLTASILIIPYVMSGLLYTIILHAKLGKTIGKAVVNISVVKLNGEKIGWKEAWRRSAVDVLLSLHVIITIPLIVWQLPSENFMPNGFLALYRSEIKPQLFESYAILEVLSFIWILSEFVTMFFNKKRRALHDFIAGTIVVKS